MEIECPGIDDGLCTTLHTQLAENAGLLGGGIPLFQDVKDPTKLKLLEAKTFQAGVVGLHYQAVRP